MSEKKPRIVAHRGSSGSAPENTLSAFRQAVADGSDMIELDVRMTRDCEWVVHHDRSVYRTTRKRGKIWDFFFTDLQRLDAGQWFGPEFVGERIPSLREVMAILPESISLDIEVKTDGDTRKRIPFEDTLINLINVQGFSKRVLVSSFDHGFLRRFRDRTSDISTGALYSPVRDLTRKASAIARKAGASAFICSISQLQRRFVDDKKTSGIILGCYGVNTLRQFEKAIRSEVDLIITDHPAWMREMLNAKLRG